MIILRTHIEEQREFGIFGLSFGKPSMSNVSNNAQSQQTSNSRNSRQRRSKSYRNPQSGVLNNMPQGHNISINPVQVSNTALGNSIDFNTARQNMPKSNEFKVKRYQKFNKSNGIKNKKALRRSGEIKKGLSELGEKGLRRHANLVSSGNIKEAEDKLIRKSRRWNRIEDNDKLVSGRSKADRWNNLSLESKKKLINSRREKLGRNVVNNNATPMIGSGARLTKEQRINRLSNQHQVNYYRNVANSKVSAGNPSVTNIKNKVPKGGYKYKSPNVNSSKWKYRTKPVAPSPVKPYNTNAGAPFKVKHKSVGLSRNKKLALGATAATGLAGIGYGLYNHFKNKED